MFAHEWSFWGMHAAWWLFWIVVIAAAVFLFQAPAGRTMERETPLELLQRRYAAGEISKEEYEERRRTLEAR